MIGFSFSTSPQSPVRSTVPPPDFPGRTPTFREIFRGVDPCFVPPRQPLNRGWCIVNDRPNAHPLHLPPQSQRPKDYSPTYNGSDFTPRDMGFVFPLCRSRVCDFL